MADIISLKKKRKGKISSQKEKKPVKTALNLAEPKQKRSWTHLKKTSMNANWMVISWKRNDVCLIPLNTQTSCPKPRMLIRLRPPYSVWAVYFPVP